LRRRAHQSGMAARNAMSTRPHARPVVRQGQLLELARSTAYTPPRPVSASDLARMRRIDERHLTAPFAGARMVRDLLRSAGHRIGRTRVRTMMARMGLKALYRNPPLSQRHPAHSGISVSAPPSGDHLPQPCVGGGYHVPADGTWLCVSLRGDGLGESPSVGVAAVQHADDRLLHGGGTGGPGQLGHANHLQYGPRRPVHEPGVHGVAERP
jgi:hypothetical protein